MDRITIAHGAGGSKSHELIKNMFFKYLGNRFLDRADDACVLDGLKENIVFSTDSFVVHPIFFPGGDIGKLAVCGTVNDLTVSGAKPLYLSCAFIIEEGFKLSELERIVRSIAEWSEKADVKIVCGDTKVVEKGAADGIFINTSGIGKLTAKKEFNEKNIVPGDKVIVSGTLGDHGIAILSKRKGLEFEGDIASDCAPLYGMLGDIIERIDSVKFMRDPTRGGLATTLNEITENSDYGIVIDEAVIPLSKAVKGASELLGLDPLYMANEGKAIIIIDRKSEKDTLDILHSHRYGVNAGVIGEVTDEFKGKVCLKTKYGVTRVLDMLESEPLPRIC